MPIITERRYLATQLRADGAAGSKMVLSGTAARYETLSENLGGFRERLARRCFRDSVASNRDIAMLGDHSSALVLGRRSNGSLVLNEDNVGLHFRCELNPNVSHATDWHAMCTRSDIKECSFSFTADDEDWEEAEDEDSRGYKKQRIPIRVVKRATLYEISAVSQPAYSGGVTSVSASVEPADPLSESSYIATRTFFPAGVPISVRSHVPNIETDPEWERLQVRVQVVLTRSLRDEL
jgi:uncharacterized protein